MKRGIIDSDNDFRETFKSIIEPFNLIIEKINVSTIQNNISCNNDDNDLVIPDFKKKCIAPYEYKVMIKHLDYIMIIKMIDLKNQISLLLLLIIIYMFLKYTFHWSIGLWLLLCKTKPIKVIYEHF